MNKKKSVVEGEIIARIIIIGMIIIIIIMIIFDTLIPLIIPENIKKMINTAQNNSNITQKNCTTTCIEKGLIYAGTDEAGIGYTSHNTSYRCICLNTSTIKLTP
jgi:hypothetical protein